MIVQVYTWFYLMFLFVGIGTMLNQNKLSQLDFYCSLLVIPIIGRVLGWW